MQLRAPARLRGKAMNRFRCHRAAGRRPVLFAWGWLILIGGALAEHFARLSGLAHQAVIAALVALLIGLLGQLSNA